MGGHLQLQIEYNVPDDPYLRPFCGGPILLHLTRRYITAQ
jgi:hypothetical protein